MNEKCGICPELRKCKPWGITKEADLMMNACFKAASERCPGPETIIYPAEAFIDTEGQLSMIVRPIFYCRNSMLIEQIIEDVL